jgi:hypothetical protein
MNIILVLILAVLAVFSRLIPIAPNFTPIISVALFAGAYVNEKHRGYAVLILLGMLLTSDAILGFYDRAMMAFVYGAVLLAYPLGFMLSGKVRLLNTLGYSLAGAMMFFIITNFGVWLVGGLYPLTFAGLAECFVLAVPFFRNTLASTFFYSVALFGLYELLAMMIPAKTKVA